MSLQDRNNRIEWADMPKWRKYYTVFLYSITTIFCMWVISLVVRLIYALHMLL